MTGAWLVLYDDGGRFLRQVWANHQRGLRLGAIAQIDHDYYRCTGRVADRWLMRAGLGTADGGAK